MSQENRHVYVPAFDGLRGVAILPVLLLHVGASVLPNGPLLSELTRGWYGVDLFFVLSGFLITWILQGEIAATGTIDLKRFYRRRFLRLGPAYLSMLTAVLMGALLLNRPEVKAIPRILPALFTYTYNYQIAVGGTHFDIIVVLWSLCVEEQFYLFWPTALRWLGIKRALPFCLIAILTLTTYRIGLYSWLNWGHLTAPTPDSSVWIYFATDTRIGVILLGCAAALSLRHRRARLMWRWMRESRWLPETLVVLTGLCVAFVTGGTPSSASWRSATFGYTLEACATAALIGAVFVQPSSMAARALSWRPLAGLGRISYGVYLFHAPIAWLALHLITPETLSRMSSTLVVGMASGAFVPPFNASGYLQPAMIINPTALRFAIVSLIVLIATSGVAGVHFRYVERRFLAMRSAPGASRSSREPHPQLAQTGLSGPRP
jgi:peptidoglycan/LPS O-acetylase OafA/YrhL